MSLMDPAVESASARPSNPAEGTSAIIQVREHAPGVDIEDFIRAGEEVFRGDPNWIAPLRFDLKARLTPGKNPLFEHAEVALFTAWKSGRLVGRISAQIDYEHLRIHRDGAGFFGFFDTIDDVDVGRALLLAAEGWLKSKGARSMRGPMSLSINEEVGLLVDGFEHPNAMMMAHSRDWQGAIAEAYGLTKLKDLYSWSYEAKPELPKRVEKAWQSVQSLPEVRFRSVDKKNFRRELDTLLEIFNDAWSENWGFVPATPNEVRKSGDEMKLILDPALAFFAEIDGRPVGVCVGLPNINQATKDLNGRLFPTGFAKLLYRVKVEGLSQARLMMLGLRKELRGVKRYGALSTAMYAELAKRGYAKGYRWCELSWTLEDNQRINLGIRAMGGKRYKTYRIYQREVAR
ncbi:MAG: hypothetical protein AAF550_00415 [Myxococcota bacterium]